MKKIKRHNISHFLLLTLAFIITISATAHAKNRNGLTTEEYIATAFYKTGGKIPNFDRWIRERSPYIITPSAQRDKVYREEMERLQKGYIDFDPSSDLILIRTKSKIKVSKHEDQDYNSTYYASAKFIELPDALYFPYDLLGERISVMPYNLENSMKTEITEAQYTQMKLTGAYRENLDTIIRMRPIESDFSQPHYLDAYEHWVLKTYVVSIEYRDDNDNLVWEYAGEGYSTEIKKEVDILYDERPYGNKKGNVKPLTSIPK